MLHLTSRVTHLFELIADRLAPHPGDEGGYGGGTGAGRLSEWMPPLPVQNAWGWSQPNPAIAEVRGPDEASEQPTDLL